MYVIIVGAGSIGTELARELTERKREIVLIDNNKDVCDELYAAYGVETVCGDATEVSVLKAAGIDKADIVVATMRNDAANLALSVLAKSFAVPEIIVRMNKKSYLEAYKTAGVTTILSVVDSLVSDMLYQIEKPDVRQVALLGDGAVELFFITIPPNARIVGKTISEIDESRHIPEECIFAGVFNQAEKEFKLARGNTRIQGGEILFVITKPEHVQKAAKYLMKR
jgi:trk system potassium uptake protein TrkA